MATTKSDENFIVTLFIIGVFIIGMLAGAVMDAVVDRNRDTQTVCDYLHAEREGNVCIKNGEVVFTKK